MNNIYNEISRTDLNAVACVVEKRQYRYGDLFGMIDGFVNTLHRNDVAVGDRVALLGLANVELLVAYYGCARVGAVAVPVSFSESAQIKDAITNASAVATIELLPEAGQPDTAPACATVEEAMVIYTSGTTSAKLKGVRLSHAGISSTAKFMNRKMAVDRTIREYVFAAIDHAYGFGRCHAVLSVGGTIILPRNISNPLVLFSEFSANDCNALAVAPSIITTILRAAPDQFDVISGDLKWLQTGAMRFDRQFREHLLMLLPQTRIFLHYGLSEAMRVTFFELNAWPDKMHSEGPAADGVELRIVDDSLSPVVPGQEGLVSFRGRNLCLGYLDDAQWASVFRDGWFITSDRGYLDEDGFLVFMGRADDVINLNGSLVHPDEIESRLAGLFPDQSVTVVGMRDPAGVKDMIAVLVVEGDTAIKIGEVAQYLRDKGSNVVPSMIRSLPVLPRTRSGKVQRSAIVKGLTD